MHYENQNISVFNAFFHPAKQLSPSSARNKKAWKRNFQAYPPLLMDAVGVSFPLRGATEIVDGVPQRSSTSRPSARVRRRATADGVLIRKASPELKSAADPKRASGVRCLS